MRKRFILPSAALAIGLLTLAAHALVMTDTTGKWPSDWPKELEALRARARTIEIAAGNQEDVYEIPFADRTEFEKAWPAILSVKTPGAPLRLSAVGASTSSLVSNALPAVRIYGPALGAFRTATGTLTPWPKSLYGPNGELPEYVKHDSKDGKETWIAAANTGAESGFIYRARVEVELVVDGQVIDLNRIKLPEATPVEDHRFDSH